MNGSKHCDVVERCGGCPWLAHGADEEREHKRSRLRALLASVSAPDTPLEFYAGDSRIGYRNRLRLRIDPQGQVAFFNAEKSPACAVLQPELRQFVQQLRAWSLSRGAADLIHFAHLEARAPDANGRAGLFLTYGPEASTAATLPSRIASDLGPVLVATDRDAEVPEQCFAHFAGTRLFAPLDGFIQVNPVVNQSLVEQVVRGTRACGCTTFADLFGGAGNFALPLAHAGLTGTLVEQHTASVQAAIRSARALELVGLECQSGDAITAARQYLRAGSRFDAILLDPPRAGVRDGLEVIARLARRTIVYCSCNLETLARDLGVLRGAGWSLQHLAGFDMFPGTRHVEALACLVPKNHSSRA